MRRSLRRIDQAGRVNILIPEYTTDPSSSNTEQPWVANNTLKLGYRTKEEIIVRLQLS